MPIVSVIIPNYNHAAFLKQRIESVLNQTFQDFELIILDDCSTDNSREIIEKYRSNPKIKSIVYNIRNSGSPFKQWKKGIELSRGEYIWIAESDDWAEPSFINELLSALIKDKSIVTAYCQSNRIDDKGQHLGNWSDWTSDITGSNFFATKFKMDGPEFIKRFLLLKNVIPNASAVIFRKNIYKKVKGADSRIKYCSDWLTWMKMLMYGRVFFNNSSLNNFREHSDSVISSAFVKEKFIKKYDIKMRKAFDKFLKRREASVDIRELNHSLLIQELIIERDFWQSQKEPTKEFKYRVQLMLAK